jgi:hypothetical protein
MVDWTEAESQSQYTKSASGDAEQPLWAEEWEDETEETEFSIQLKYSHFQSPACVPESLRLTM